MVMKHQHEETAKDDWVEDADGNFVKKEAIMSLVRVPQSRTLRPNP